MHIRASVLAALVAVAGLAAPVGAAVASPSQPADRTVSSRPSAARSLGKNRERLLPVALLNVGGRVQ